MSVRIYKSGIQDTVQDQGRYGFSHWGINPGGVMDHYAAAVANALVGNPASAAVVELSFPAAQVLFESTTLISICGADFSPVIASQPVPCWQPLVVRENTLLHFDRIRSGMYTYLAIHGGIDVEPWLHSRSTHLKAGAGGYQGRRLFNEDQLPIGASSFGLESWLKPGESFTALPWKAAWRDIYEAPETIALTRGQEWSRLDTCSREWLVTADFAITSASNRMGANLAGPELRLEHPYEMLSTGVTAGTLQLLPGGQLIALLADHQTTGGYPRVGHIHTAQLPAFVQARPGQTIRFRLTDPDEAEMVLLEQQKDLALLKRNCTEHLLNWKK